MLRVLIIEDEHLFGRSVVKWLERYGYQCKWATTIAEGKVLSREFHPDLLLLDSHLPDGNGLNHLPEFSESATKIVVISADIETYHDLSLTNNNAVNYLKKPIDLNELLSRLKDLEPDCVAS